MTAVIKKRERDERMKEKAIKTKKITGAARLSLAIDLEKAFVTFQLFEDQLRALHRETFDTGDGFARLVLHSLLQDSVKLHWMLSAALRAGAEAKCGGAK
jgi:hypothetical protein